MDKKKKKRKKEKKENTFLGPIVIHKKYKDEAEKRKKENTFLVPLSIPEIYKDNAEKEETGKIVKCLLVSYHKRFIHRGTCKDDISMKREMLSHFGLDLKCNLELVSLVKVWVVRGFSGIRPMMAIAPPPPCPCRV